MNEQYTDRNSLLERSVRRWRLVSFILAVLLICSVAIGGTFVAVLLMQLPHQNEMQMLLLREQDSRRQAEQAKQRAEQALREAEAAKRNAVNDP
jgi:hypothetical protein